MPVFFLPKPLLLRLSLHVSKLTFSVLLQYQLSMYCLRRVGSLGWPYFPQTIGLVDLVYLLDLTPDRSFLVQSALLGWLWGLPAAKALSRYGAKALRQ